MSKSVSFSFLNNLGYPTQKQRYIKCVASCYPYFTKNHLIREFFPQILENTFGLKYRGVLTEVFAQISLRLMHRFFPADLRGLPADSAEHFRLEISCKLLPKKPAEGSPKNPRYPRHPCSTPIRIIPRKNPRYPRHPCSTPIRVIPRKNPCHPCHPCSTPIRVIPRKNPRYPCHPCSPQSVSSVFHPNPRHPKRKSSEAFDPIVVSLPKVLLFYYFCRLKNDTRYSSEIKQRT
jgi:hypothetical protein